MTRTEVRQLAQERRRLRLATPSTVALAASEASDEQLDPFVLAVRNRLDRYTADAGGAAVLPATKQAQIRSLVEAELVLEPLTRDVLELARAGQLWSLRTRKASVLLHDWLKLKTHRDALLVAVGLERATAPTKDLATVIREIEQSKAERAKGSVADPVGSQAEQGARASTDASREAMSRPSGHGAAPQVGEPLPEQAPAASRTSKTEPPSKPAEPVEVTPRTLMPEPEQTAALQALEF